MEMAFLFWRQIMVYENIGAYLQIYKNDGKPEFTLESFRKYYPNSPIYLVSDNGYNFSSTAQVYDCKYEHSDFNTGIRPGGFTLQEMMVWINRIKRCFDFCNTDYVIYLEDDVYIRNKIDVETEYKICGFYNNDIPQKLIQYIQGKYPNSTFNIDRYGACGGAIYHRETFLNLFDQIIYFFNNHYDYIKTSVSDKMAYLDCTMCVLYMTFGYKYGQSKNLIDPWHWHDWKTLPNPIIHFGDDGEKQIELMRFLKQ
jgi:hypothetical protein